MAAAENKQLVLEWFTSGPYGGEEMLTDDFVWHTPHLELIIQKIEERLSGKETVRFDL